jgi:hypothetical protein
MLEVNNLRSPGKFQGLFWHHNIRHGVRCLTILLGFRHWLSSHHQLRIRHWNYRRKRT